MSNDMVNKLYDLSFILVPAVILITMFIVMEKRKKKD